MIETVDFTATLFSLLRASPNKEPGLGPERRTAYQVKARVSEFGEKY
jgi:hypothetical protein